jgi:signal transduction histidine kinase
MSASFPGTVPAIDACSHQQHCEDLSRFNRHVAHDLCGPLLTLAGVAERANQALQQGDAEFTQRLLAMMIGHTDRLRTLVSELLWLAEASGAPLPQAPLDLNAVVQEAIDALQAQWATAPARPQAAVVPQFVVQDLPAARGSAVLLRQVFVNLLANAAKFASTERRPVVEIDVAEVGGGGRAIRVQDNGVGFCHMDPGRAFEPFARLHGSQYPGHGIGLSFVKQVVERHGGSVWARPRLPYGATMAFTLPSLA